MNKTLISWSSGKDSAWLVHTIRTSMPDYDVSALLTTINESAQRVAMHAVRVDVLQAQADAIGAPQGAVHAPADVRVPTRGIRRGRPAR